jgi:SAM-dependent methyltransferase
MHLNSELIFEEYAKRYSHEHMRVLEIGLNTIPSTYCQIVGKKSIVWETLDIADDGKLTYVAENEYKFPVPDDTFDIVLSGQVIEQVRKIWVWVKELARVCKKGGKVIIIAPFSWTYHKAPVDCWRIYPDGMKALCEEADSAMDLCTMENREYISYNLSFLFYYWGLLFSKNDGLGDPRSCRSGGHSYHAIYNQMVWTAGNRL